MNYIISTIIPLLDFCMVKLFGSKARWFQLHAIINIIIVYLVSSDTYILLKEPILPLPGRNTQINLALELSLTLHIYHFFINTLTPIEIWHHIIFVLGGVIPAIVYFNSQIIAILLFTGCGFPGAMEYTMLALVKHNRITSLTQKMINSWVNNYIRAPLSIYSATLVYINALHHDMIVYYVCFLIYLNSTFFSKMAIENHIRHKCNINIDVP